MRRPEAEVCLEIDRPENNTFTTFTKVDRFERPENIRPDGISETTELYAAEIYMPPKVAKDVINCIEKRWKSDDDALFLQFIADGNQTGIIIGYTDLGLIQGFSHIRIYTSA